MSSRIVVFGATGYTGRLVAERLVARGERPVLAGRDARRLAELSERLGGQALGDQTARVAGGAEDDDARAHGGGRTQGGYSGCNDYRSVK